MNYPESFFERWKEPSVLDNHSCILFHNVGLEVTSLSMCIYFVVLNEYFSMETYCSGILIESCSRGRVNLV